MAQRGSTAPQGRRIYLKGLGSQGSLRLGAFVWRSAPRGRKKEPTQYQRYAQQTMTVAGQFVRMMTAWERQTAADLAKGSGFTWRDMLISSFYGNAIEFTDDNGVLWQGRRILADNIQQLLDSISAAPGSILVRTPTAWAALFSGANNQVLTIDPTTGLPNWLAAQSGGGAAELVAQFQSDGNATDAFASLGYWFTFNIPCTIKALSALLRPGAIGRTYTLNLGKFDGSTKKLTAAAITAGTFTASSTSSPQQVAINLPSPVVVTAGDTYAFWLSQTFGSATTTPDTYFTTTKPVNSFYFTVPIANGIKLAKNAPATTDTWTAGSAHWAMSFLYEP